MASDLPDLHDRALAETRRYVAGVGGDQWKSSSPCEGWDVSELVNHIVSGNFWAGELARGKTIDEVGDRLDGDILGDDPTAAYDESARAASEAFHAPGAMEAPCAVSYGPVPGEVYLGHRFIDVVVHGWDVARASGHAYIPDPAAVEAIHGFLAQFATPEQAAMRSNIFGPIVPVPDQAPLFDRVLGLAGRDPGWTPG
jgi:uncharacterized protein (TIGR03086 family)